MIVTCFDLSNYHLRRDTMRLLSELSPEQRLGYGWPAMTVANYAHGVFVTVPERSDDTLDQWANLPHDLEFVLGHARNYGVNLIRFDTDGNELPDLDVYIW